MSITEMKDGIEIYTNNAHVGIDDIQFSHKYLHIDLPILIFLLTISQFELLMTARSCY
jgi:hypothetical protein